MVSVQAWMDGSYAYQFGYFSTSVDLAAAARPGCSQYTIWADHALLTQYWQYYYLGPSAASDFYCRDTGGGGGGGGGCLGSPPSISNISPAQGLAAEGYIPIYGSNFTANGSPQVMMDGSPLTNLTYTADSQINAYHANQPVGEHSITVSTPCGTSNAVNFTVVNADVTPYISSINPATWAAGTTVQLHISGTGFGMSPQLQINAVGVTVSSMVGWDTGIDATLIISSNAPDQFNVPVTVTSTGIWGQGFQGNPGQSNQAQTQAQVQAQASGCGDQRDTLIQEYAAYGVNLSPQCASFTQSARSVYFSYAELTVNSTYSWAIIQNALTVGASSGYGLDRWRELLGSQQNTNSVYRSPAHNASVGGAPQSRHMYGDAVDLRNASQSESEYWDKACKARKDYNAAFISHCDQNQPDAGATFVEPLTGPCGLGCVHADWR